MQDTQNVSCHEFSCDDSCWMQTRMPCYIIYKYAPFFQCVHPCGRLAAPFLHIVFRTCQVCTKNLLPPSSHAVVILPVMQMHFYKLCTHIALVVNVRQYDVCVPHAKTHHITF